MTRVTLETTEGVMLSIEEYNKLSKANWATDVVASGILVTLIRGEKIIGLCIPPSTTFLQLKQIAIILLGEGYMGLCDGVGCYHEDHRPVTDATNDERFTDKRSIRLFWS